MVMVELVLPAFLFFIPPNIIIIISPHHHQFISIHHYHLHHQLKAKALHSRLGGWIPAYNHDNKIITTSKNTTSSSSASILGSQLHMFHN
jgi:hypothetical protein